MVSSFKKKTAILIVTSLIISMVLLSGMPSIAFASSKRATVAMSPKETTSSLAVTRNATKDGYAYTPSNFSNRKNYQVTNQNIQTNDYNSNNPSYEGVNQNNSGNEGNNWGYYQNNHNREGNQVNN